MHRSKIFGNSQIPAMVTNSILKLNCQLSKLINETMYTRSHILDSSVSKTIACRSNLSIPHISEKKLDEQLAAVRKELHVAERFSQ